MVRSQVKFAQFASTIDDDLALRACPDATRDYVVTDSDEILAFELSGPERIVGGDFRKGSVASVASWVERGTNQRHRMLARCAIRIHSGSMTEALWRSTEEAGERVIAAVSHINGLSSLLLALRYPSVMSWRLNALARGPVDSRRYRFWSRLIPTVLMRLLNAHRVLYAAIFLDHGVPRPWHPRWLLRRSALAALLDAIGLDDHDIVLVGGDAAVSGQLERARPGIKVTVLDPKTALVELPLVPQRLGKSTIDAVIELDFETMSGEVERAALAPLLGYGRRFVLMGMAPRLVGQAAASPVAVELRSFGRSGTRFCYHLWCQLRRARDKVNGSAFRLLLKLAGLLVTPVLLPVGALGSFVLNVAALGLDMLPVGNHNLMVAPLADSSPPRIGPPSRPTH